MGRRELGLVAVVVFAGCGPRGKKNEEPFDPPKLTAPFIAGAAIELDGKLDEDAWRKAAETSAFVDIRTGKAASRDPRGTARVFWDEQHLYVAFTIQDERVEAWVGDRADMHLWERDAVEVLLDPDDADNRDYYQIEIDPQGRVYDTRFDEREKPRGSGRLPTYGHEDWSSAVERGAHVRGTVNRSSDKDEGYVVEARIPWTSLTKAKRAPPSPGDVWKMNFYAIESGARVAWSPILERGSSFHSAAFWGDVTFAR